MRKIKRCPCSVPLIDGKKDEVYCKDCKKSVEHFMGALGAVKDAWYQFKGKKIVVEIRKPKCKKITRTRKK